MKTMLKYMAMGLAASLAFGAGSARASLEVSARFTIRAKADFYAPLSASGKWIEVGAYGRCWHPVGVAVGWRPYCYGQWVWTDCGWYWESDEPWAWACYHYGTWVLDPEFGWVWVPDIEWAPAWVYWREGGGYVGWAPCAPAGVGVVFSTFVFVETRNFEARHSPSTVIVNNTTIINQTRGITAAEHSTRLIGGHQQEVIVNRGPDPQTLQTAAAKKYRAIPIQEADRRTTIPSAARRKIGKPAAAMTAPALRSHGKSLHSPRDESILVPQPAAPPATVPGWAPGPPPPGTGTPARKNGYGPPSDSPFPPFPNQPDVGPRPQEEREGPHGEGGEHRGHGH